MRHLIHAASIPATTPMTCVSPQLDVRANVEMVPAYFRDGK